MGNLLRGVRACGFGVIWVINRCINVFVYGDDFASYDEHPFDGFKIRSWQNVLKTPLLALLLVGIFLRRSAVALELDGSRLPYLDFRYKSVRYRKNSFHAQIRTVVLRVLHDFCGNEPKLQS